MVSYASKYNTNYELFIWFRNQQNTGTLKKLSIPEGHFFRTRARQNAADPQHDEIGVPYLVVCFFPNQELKIADDTQLGEPLFHTL